MSDKRYQEEYLRRIHKVQDYIEQHTGRALTVEELSNVAGFSMFHFSRIFQDHSVWFSGFLCASLVLPA